ncbi:MAG: LysR family transcriptional regulator [Candidatus Dactylopiibacterium carminicum]|uniref:LysR family transcriptional regulator n=1 Tax=Candidatus Dactylopiibacterium carminicum TaxID=857335 RepID=A0A272ESB7_9RHOO|nr:LysR family transcriptional regulator [Candidatus Dactylopiibacterium carminicum]KAF7600683.1 LysR family transcriptional regulator [Candidatus Dactylopiibacterium carminicum]PAS92985.1 MAG: LysR family transcriptional regulator [Candidatus Dactylopiibacterium carminicum]PAS96534.1 MAG: LysR family transcriptional regulator [Candidatus Dactylopiibacterium carminicum]PAT00685.1 MAG: hypothetical protein BSR46_00790 [Candidatus Dactylopiibacterium carminicum]
MERLINMASFAEVVEAGSFSAAAERLGCSRAVLSKRIRVLEQDFGVTLLHRTTRRQSLTEAGEALYAHCRRVLDEMNSAEARLQALTSTPSGTLRISAPHSWGNRVLAPRLAAFLLQHPQVRVELGLSDHMVDLAGSAVDVALRLTSTPAPGLVARHLADLPYVICAAPAYLALHGEPAHPRELAQHRCVHFVGETVQNPWRISDAQGVLHEVAVRGPLVANSTEVLRTMARAGLGIIMLSRYLIEDELASGQLQPILRDCTPPVQQLHLVTLPDRLLAAKTRAFIDFMRA